MRAFALVAAIASACGSGSAGGAAREPAWPADAVAVVAGIAISRAELDAAAAALGEVNPAWTRRALLREAFATHVVPRAAAQAARPSESAAARAALEADLAGLRGGRAGPEISALDGAPVDLTFDVWQPARGAPLGEWSGPFAGRSAWLALRVLARERGDAPARDRYEVEVVRRNFLPPHERAEDLVDGRELVVLDPELDELVPLALRSRMRGPPMREPTER